MMPAQGSIDVRVSVISKMAVCDRKWIDTTNLPQNLTLKNSPFRMLDAKNVSISLGMSILCIQAEIYVIP